MVLVVYLIRTRAFDYAWRIAIVAGGVTYVLVMLGGSLFLNATVSMPALITCAVLSVVFAIILEFFVLGGDYSRTERLEYEDDEYFYYVKAVPKASVSTSERSIREDQRRAYKGRETFRRKESGIFHRASAGCK